MEPGDFEEGMRAAEAIGDDTLQKQTQGTVVPDSFTHGTSAQRMEALRRGFKTGDQRRLQLSLLEPRPASCRCSRRRTGRGTRRACSSRPSTTVSRDLTVPLGDPGAHLAIEFVHSRLIVEHDEALDADPRGDDPHDEAEGGGLASL